MSLLPLKNSSSNGQNILVSWNLLLQLFYINVAWMIFLSTFYSWNAYFAANGGNLADYGYLLGHKLISHKKNNISQQNEFKISLQLWLFL